MMYFLLILFFGSLLGIIFMIGRKLTLVKNDQALQKNEDASSDMILEEWKHKTIQGIRKYSYDGLVEVVRLYVYSSDYIKRKYQELKIRINKKFGKKVADENKKETSKFLRIISDYKHKIRKIRLQIKEEEKI